MHYLLLGVSHHTCPVAVRERVAFGPQELPAALARLRERGLPEAVLLSTCNRTEVYGVAADSAAGLRAAALTLEERCGGAGVLQGALYRHTGLAVARHAFRVAAGLDSLVLGEGQILGQVREALAAAQAAGGAGGRLTSLFRAAIGTARRIRRETGLGAGAASVSYAAVELARKIFDDLRSRSVLLLGAGKMSELAARNLAAQGVAALFVANRRRERAEALARELGGRAVGFAALRQWLPKADIVIASTGAPHPVIPASLVREAVRLRKGRPLFLIDIAVPRDVDPTAAELEGVFLYNIDDLKGVVEANLSQRKEHARTAEAVVEEEVRAFAARQDERRAVPLITELRRRAEDIRREELEKVLRRLSDLEPREREQVQALTLAIVNKLLHEPTVRLKERVAGPEGERYARMARDLFGLTPPAPGAEPPARARHPSGLPAGGRLPRAAGEGSPP